MPEEKEADEVALGPPKRRKNGGYMAKETSKDADKGFVVHGHAGEDFHFA